jgi:flagellar assembly protein FliH
METVVIKAARGIGGVRILRGYSEGAAVPRFNAEQQKLEAELKRQRDALASAAKALESAAAQVKSLYEQAVAAHGGEIAKLAVEIAKKVLCGEVQEHHYKIETIIAEAAKNLPSRDDVVIHVNPADEAALRENAAAIGELKDIRIASDQAVGCAGCVLETPKGIVESFVEQRLEQIGRALQEIKN